MLCSWARHVTLTVPLSRQVYKWVQAKLTLGYAGFTFLPYQITHYKKLNNNSDNLPIKNLQTLTVVGGDKSYVLKYFDWQMSSIASTTCTSRRSEVFLANSLSISK